jgi:glycosyltransferase involved in cell wall biosynthesis
MSERSASVSLCMIVRDEAHQLDECLAPVAELFDEIVIVDTGSRDETRRIARRFTPHVHDFAWRDDFAAARNESLRRATGDWVFWLDADDRLTPENVARLRRLLASLSLRPAIFLMDVVCLARNPGEMERVTTHPRLFRRQESLAWCGRIHEQLCPWPAPPSFDTNFSDVRIDHLGYRDAALAQRKAHRNLRLLRMDYAVNPDDSTTLMELGLACTRLARPAEARRYFSRFLETAPPSCVHTRRVFAALVELAIQEGKFQEAVDKTARGLVLFPGDDYLAFMQTEALYQLGEYEAARLVLLRIIERPEPPRDYCVGAPGEIRRKLAPLGLGEVLRMQRAYDRAEAVLRNVVRDFPDDPVCWNQLGRVYIEMGNGHKLQQVLDRLSTCPRGDLFASLLIAGWRIARGQLNAAESAIDGLIAQAPQMSLPRVLRAQCLKLREAPRSVQAQACRDVLRVQPGNAYAISVVAKREATVPAPAIASRSDLYGSVVVVVGVPGVVLSA